MHKMMILSILFFLNLPFLSAGNPQIVDVDFNRHSGILHVQARGSYSGPMVQGMNQDFTAWSSGVCRAESGTDTLGDTFLRFFIDKPGVQFNIRLPGLQAKKLYKATFVVRNQLTGEITPYLRRMYKPYTLLGADRG